MKRSRTIGSALARLRGRRKSPAGMRGSGTRERFEGASESLTASATLHAPLFRRPLCRAHHRADL